MIEVLDACCRLCCAPFTITHCHSPSGTDTRGEHTIVFFFQSKHLLVLHVVYVYTRMVMHNTHP